MQAEISWGEENSEAAPAEWLHLLKWLKGAIWGASHSSE